MKILSGLKYSKEHEWIKVEGNKAYIGITDHAQSSLGSIVFVELPPVGDTIEAGGAMGVVESVKAASDIYSPVSGEIVEVNDALEASPELLNEEPYENHIAVIELSDVTELDGLMDDTEYEKFVSEGA